MESRDTVVIGNAIRRVHHPADGDRKGARVMSPLRLVSADVQQPSTTSRLQSSPCIPQQKHVFQEFSPEKPPVMATIMVVVVVVVIRTSNALPSQWARPLITDLAVGLSPHDPTRDELSCPRPRSSTPFHHDGPDAMWTDLPGVLLVLHTSSVSE